MKAPFIAFRFAGFRMASTACPMVGLSLLQADLVDLVVLRDGSPHTSRALQDEMEGAYGWIESEGVSLLPSEMLACMPAGVRHLLETSGMLTSEEAPLLRGIPCATESAEITEVMAWVRRFLEAAEPVRFEGEAGDILLWGDAVLVVQGI